MKPILILLILLLTSASSPCARRSWQQPNFVLIVAEDLGREWLGCYGGEEIRTPEIDRLAANGARIETCYAAPMPSISKVELLTGRYPFRNGWMWANDVPKFGLPELDPAKETTFARPLKAAGYRTGFAGVWGLNGSEGLSGVLERHGFDWSLVSADRDAIEAFASQFVEESMGGPFALCAMLPGSPSAEGFKDHIAGMDALVGRLVGEIRRNGLDRQTIVILTSAGGTDGVEARAWGNQIVKGGQGTMLEVGINVPLIVSGSYWVKRGEVIGELVDFTDVLPTLIDLSGARLPRDRVLDGRSFADVLNGRAMKQPREWIFSQQGGDRVVRNPRYKLYSNGRFYDALADPLETRNLGDVGNSEVVGERERLAAILRSFPRDEPLAFPYARRLIIRRPR